MHSFDADSNTGGEDREIDEIAEDAKGRGVAERPAEEEQHHVGGEEDQQRQPIFGPINAASKVEEEGPRVHLASRPRLCVSRRAEAIGSTPR